VAAGTALEIVIDPCLAAHLADLGHRYSPDQMRRPAFFERQFDLSGRA
jgi:hypothetical protein